MPIHTRTLARALRRSSLFCLLFAAGVPVAAAAPPRDTAAEAEAFVRSAFNRCGATVTPVAGTANGAIAEFWVQGSDRRVRVRSAAACTQLPEHKPAKQPARTVVEVGFEVLDERSSELLAKAVRAETLPATDCTTAWRTAEPKLHNKPVRDLCTRGFHPTPDVALDIGAVLLPEMLKAGPVTPVSSSDSGNTVSWSLRQRSVDVSMRALCITSRELEGPRAFLGTRMGVYDLDLQVRVRAPKERIALGIWNARISAPALDCDRVFTSADRQLQKFVSKVVTEAQANVTRAGPELQHWSYTP